MYIVGKVSGAKERLRINWRKMQAASHMDIQSICVMIGPYRNLTTLTAACFHLHPQCQVLNHAGKRVLPDSKLNFLSEPSHERLHEFCRFAIAASQGGKRGSYGGSITLSHAFDRDELKQRYYRRYGRSLIKDTISCLLWKESYRAQIYLKYVDLARLITQLPILKFLLPIRNPIDTALSNMKTNHVNLFPQVSRIGSDIDANLCKLFPSLDSPLDPGLDVYKTLEYIMEELYWGVTMADLFPNNFTYFFPFELTKVRLRELTSYLGMSSDSAWEEDVIDAWNAPLVGYKYPNDLVEFYKQLVHEYYQYEPELKARFSRFLEHNEHNEE